MPTRTKKNYKRRYKKKYNPRKFNRNKDLTLIKEPKNGGFPKSVFTKLRYVWNGTLNPGAGGINAIQVFRANSVYDPDYTGAGNQPRGFDEWMAVYDHFYVKRSKIKVTFHNGDGSLENIVGVALRDDFATEANPVDYQEQDCKWRLIGRVNSSDNHCVIRKYYNYAKQNYSKYTDDQNKGSVAGDPSEVGYFHCFAGQPWGSDSTNIYVTAEIIYDVLFTELKDFTQS